MQRLEVSGVVRPLYGSLRVKGLISLLPVSSVFLPLVAILILINPFPMPRSIPLSLTVPRPHFKFFNRQLLYGDTLRACHPSSILEGQSTVFVTPVAGWPSYTPQVPGTHFNRLLQPAWTKVGLFFSPVTTKETIY